MSKAYVISDLHFGHKAICKYRPQFTTPKEHDEYICDMWQQTVTKRDSVYVLGDACFTEEAVDLVGKLNGTKLLIAGNHDDLPASSYLRVFRNVRGLQKRKGIWLSHAPIHPDELRGCSNIHGHIHEHVIDDCRYFNACCEQVNYTPQDLSVVKQVLEGLNE